MCLLKVLECIDIVYASFLASAAPVVYLKRKDALMKINPKPFMPLLVGFYKFWHWLVRYDDKDEWKPLIKAIKSGTPAIVALWHSEIFPLSGFGSYQDSNYVVIVSQSRDGDLIAGIIKELGHVTTRGSSSRGGLKALLSLVKQIKRNKKVGVFAVDGPRGPRYEIKEGVIFAAQRAGAQIFPLRAFAKKKLVFNSWDKFEVPYPFSKCRIRVGEPFYVTDEKLTAEVMENERMRLQKYMLSIEDDT